MAQQTKSRHHLSPTGRGICALAATVLLGVGALAGAQGTAMPDQGKPAMGSSSSMDMSKMMSAMMKNMNNMPMSGDTDRDFAGMMRMHHQAALDMAQAELDSGKDPQLKAMARKIISSQKKEIEEFDRWLAKYKMPSNSKKPTLK